MCGPNGVLLLIIAGTGSRTRVLSNGNPCVQLLWWGLWSVYLWGMVWRARGILAGLVLGSFEPNDSPRV